MLKKAFLVAILAFLAAGSAFAYGGNVDWIHDYDQGLALAKKTGKPILLDFGGAW